MWSPSTLFSCWIISFQRRESPYYDSPPTRNPPFLSFPPDSFFSIYCFLPSVLRRSLLHVGELSYPGTRSLHAHRFLPPYYFKHRHSRDSVSFFSSMVFFSLLTQLDFPLAVASCHSSGTSMLGGFLSGAPLPPSVTPSTTPSVSVSLPP